MKMNEANIRQFRDDFANAVLDLEAKYGIAIELRNIAYNPSSFSTRLEVKNLSEEGRPMVNPNHEASARFAIARQLSMDAVGTGPVLQQKWILTNGNTVFLEDYNSRSHKYPFIYYYNGQRYKCSPRMIARRAGITDN